MPQAHRALPTPRLQRPGPHLLVALATLCLTVYTAHVLWVFPYDGLTWSAPSGRISTVDPRGPASAAGLQPGDRLLALDGVDLRESATVYSAKRVGDTLRTLVEGRGPVTLVLRAPPHDVLARRVEPLAVGFVYWLAGLAALVFCPWQEVTAVFFLLSQAAAGMLAAGSLSTTMDPAGTTLFNVLILFLTSLTLHLLALFPQPVSPRRRGILLSGSYASSLLLAAIYLIMAAWPPRRPPSGALWEIRSVAVAANLLVALGLLLRPGRRSALPGQQRRRLLLAAITLSLLPLLGLSFVPELLQLRWQVDYAWTFPFLVLLPLSFGYAIRQGELGPVDLFLSRSLAFALLAVPLAGVSALIAAALVPPRSTIRVVVNTATILGAAALVSVLRKALQGWVDRIFYGGWYDYRGVLWQAGQQLGQVRSLDRLLALLLGVATTMRFRAAAVSWPRDGAWRVYGAYGLPARETAQLELPVRGEVAAMLAAATGLQAMESIAKALPEVAPLGAAGIEYCLPLVSRGELQAILLLGGRRGGEPLAAEDLDLLATLAAQAALAAENVALLEALKARVAELMAAQEEAAEVRRHLVEGREAERQYLARELHDGPLQELEALRLVVGSTASQASPGLSGAETAALAERVLAVIAKLRNVASELRPPSLAPFGLAAAIRSHVAQLRAAHPTLRVDLDLPSDGELLPVQVRSALYRIYREAVSNVERHAAAHRISVQLTLEPGQVSLTVSDDGQGFEVPRRWVTFARQGHLGLLGAVEWAEAAGGRLDVESSPGQGTTVRVTCGLTPGQPL